jgi:Na+-translocating ferredoxin:NAD+ oxidoreductase RnfG subunit
MEILVLSFIVSISVIINAALYGKYINTKQHLLESEDRIEDLDMVVSALQAMHDEKSPKVKTKKSSKKISKPAVKSKAKKEVAPAPKKRGRKPNS